MQFQMPPIPTILHMYIWSIQVQVMVVFIRLQPFFTGSDLVLDVCFVAELVHLRQKTTNKIWED
jgi:hypothetical protein